MAVTVTFDLPKAHHIGPKGSLALISGTIAFDNSYPTNGESVTDITKKFTTCLQVITDNFAGYLTTFDKTNKKLKVLAPVDVVAGSGTAGTNNYVFKSATSTLEVDGTGTAFQVPGAECADTTDLSAITAMRFIAVGIL